jgi:Family of unknown function (DUF6481)
MKGYKEPGFQERVAAAQAAKDKALAKLRNRPVPDAAELAARAERQKAKEAEAAARQLAKLEAKKAEQAAAEAAALEAEKSKLLSEAESKAARDARYLARKNRKN